MPTFVAMPCMCKSRLHICAGPMCAFVCMCGGTFKDFFFFIELCFHSGVNKPPCDSFGQVTGGLF